MGDKGFNEGEESPLTKPSYINGLSVIRDEGHNNGKNLFSE